MPGTLRPAQFIPAPPPGTTPSASCPAEPTSSPSPFLDSRNTSAKASRCSWAQTLRIDATLEVGATTDSVTVNEASPLLKTESGELSHNIAAQRLDELPVGSLGAILTITQIVPGANYIGANTIRLQGTPVNSEQVRVDGLDSTYSLGMSTYSFAQPSVDAIQEVAVQTSNFAAELDLPGGAVVHRQQSSRIEPHGLGALVMAGVAVPVEKCALWGWGLGAGNRSGQSRAPGLKDQARKSCPHSARLSPI